MLDTKTFDASGVAVLWYVAQVLNRSPLSHVCEGHTEAATVINQNPEFSSLPVRTSVKHKQWASVQWETANVSTLISISSARLQSWVISERIMQQSFKGTVSRFFAPGFLITACNGSKWNPLRATITTFHFVYNEALVPDNSTQLSSINKRRMLSSARHSELDKREGRNSLPQTSLD